MKFRITSPTKAYIENYSLEDLTLLAKLLTYKNTASEHLVKRHYKNVWWRQKNFDTWNVRLTELKMDVTHILSWSDERGPYIRPGSIPWLGLDAEVINEVVYPTPKKIPWLKKLPFELYPYQNQSVEKLGIEKHGSVSLTTGSGKSMILLKLYREMGLKTAIIAPSKSIFHELLEQLERHFGKGKIGKFGDGKKLLGKNITLCIGDSLANVKEGTPEWEFFSSKQVICVDESHQWGAETLESVCHGLFANTPYRFFLSGTQTRGDGSEMLLNSIIGKTVHTLSTKDAVAGGYICPHEYRIVEVESSNPNMHPKDALDDKRIHFLKNRNIANFAAKLANADALTNKRQTLILVEELEQISMLIPLLKVPFAYAHSESKPERLAELGLERVKPADSVEMFNRGLAMVLIGTSTIQTGTNIYKTHNTINWVAGTSVIKTKQGAVGRTVRKDSSNPFPNPNAPKENALIWDFAVTDADLQMTHLDKRIEHYGDSGSEIKWIKLKR